MGLAGVAMGAGRARADQKVDPAVGEGAVDGQRVQVRRALPAGRLRKRLLCGAQALALSNNDRRPHPGSPRWFRHGSTIAEASYRAGRRVSAGSGAHERSTARALYQKVQGRDEGTYWGGAQDWPDRRSWRHDVHELGVGRPARPIRQQ
ncbi:MAG: hypothetical protein QM820_32545 [Minicystis sp.]